MLYSAECNGKKVVYSKGYELLSDEDFKNINDIWYTKPDKKDVEHEIGMINHGANSLAKITKYYFSNLMWNTVKYGDKWSINDTMHSKELLSIVMQKIKDSPDFFSHNNLIRNLEQVFSLGGSSFTHKAAQFPIQVVDYILDKYNVNNVWYDYSCGWGARLAGALRNNVNYLGVDPNHELVCKLKEFKDDYKEITLNRSDVDIRCCGSENFQEDWEGKVGLAFSSPPYFSLEDYRLGNQSYKDGTTYDEWLNNYLRPTINNIYRYLLPKGYFICNIKDFSSFTLEDDLIKISNECGFELYAVETLKGKQRVGGTPKTKAGLQDRIETNMDENIYVFIKKGEIIDNKTIKKVDLFN